jgi:hypothetical protein
VIGEFDLDGAVVKQFGGAVAGDLVYFVEPVPGEADRRPAVFDIEPGLQRAEGDFAASLVGDRDRRRFAEVEINRDPRCRPPRCASGRSVVVRRGAHAGSPRSVGSRTRL